MKLSIIVAVADNGVIGHRNDLPWRLPADLRRFKALTMGHHLLLGRKTFDSIHQSLPGRTMVVISRGHPELPGGVLLARSLEEAIDIARAAGDDEAFVGGGGEIYRLALPHADRIYLTRVHGTFDGDTELPSYDESEWELISQDDRPADEKNPCEHSFLVLERRTHSKPVGDQRLSRPTPSGERESPN